MTSTTARDFFGATDGSPFPNVFLDAATLHQPSTWRDVVRLAHFLYRRIGPVTTSFERILSYFLTDIEVSGAGEDEKKKWTDFLRRDFGIYHVLQSVFRDRFAVGNSLSSLLVPFERWLSCRRCGQYGAPLREIDANKRKFEYEFRIPNFYVRCPVCQQKSAWKLDDRIDSDETRLKLKRWDILEFELLYDQYSTNTAYIWRLPEDYKRQLRQGHLHQLQHAPGEILKATAENLVYLFDKDAIFHMKEPDLATDRNRGWGIPRVYQHFSQVFQERALNRQNEAVALEWVNPIRVVVPGQRSGSPAAGALTMDPLHTLNMGDMGSQIRRMILHHRHNPAAWQTLPFPVEGLVLGGDPTKFAPAELLNQAREVLLNDLGTPVELSKGTLQLQTAPVALRLFESYWAHLLQDANRFLRWLVQQICDQLSWEQVTVELKRVTVADDLQKQMATLQMYMGQAVSGTSALKGLGLDWDREQELIAEESRRQTEIKAKLEEEIAQAGFAQQVSQGAPPGGQPQQGGAPAGGGGGAPQDPNMMLFSTPVTTYLASRGPNAPMTPDQQMADGKQLATDLLGQPSSVRRSELMKLKQSDPNMHRIVQGEMDQQRSDTKSQAGTAAMIQTYGQA